MKKIFSIGGVTAWGIVLAILLSLPIACKRDKEISISQRDVLSAKVTSIKNWWDNRKINTEILSRIPDSTTIQSYWRSQFQNGIPKWNNARIITVNDETIYEVPFQFPDNLIFLNDKPDAPPQMYITGKAGTTGAYKTSQTYLIVKEKQGSPNVAEIMCVVLNNPYVKILDSLGSGYPDIRINNVYPLPDQLGEFSGSIKFYDLDGMQLLEEGYVHGALNDYIPYGKCNFPITPGPNLSTTRVYQVCNWTYVYQQNCSADAGCTDWELIGIIFNGCETIVVPDSPPVILPGGDPGSIGGSYLPPPVIQQNPPIPNADLCGNYKWSPVGDALYCQIRNLGMTIVPNNPNSSSTYTFTLGLTCIHVPKWFVGHGYDITGFVNTAFNRARKRIMEEINAGLLRPGTDAVKDRFEEYMAFYFEFQPNGIRIYRSWGSILFRNGCSGNIPISQPKWCASI